VAPGKPFTIDTTKLPDGFHELRIVAMDASPIEIQGRVIVPFIVDNLNTKLTFTASANQIKFVDKLRLSVRQPGAESISIRQNSQELASVKGEGGDVEIAASKIGRGPAVLQAFSEGSAKAASAPVRIMVE
jgi:hypothetical protein